jgi:hypothetical protein
MQLPGMTSWHWSLQKAGRICTLQKAALGQSLCLRHCVGPVPLDDAFELVLVLVLVVLEVVVFDVLVFDVVVCEVVVLDVVPDPPWSPVEPALAEEPDPVEPHAATAATARDAMMTRKEGKRMETVLPK